MIKATKKKTHLVVSLFFIRETIYFFSSNLKN